MAFNLSAAQDALRTSFTYEVLDPFDKTPSGWVIELATAAHGTAQFKVRQILDSMGRRKAPASMEQTEQDGVALIAARVLGWHGLVDGNGAEIPYTPEMAVQVLTGAKAFWLRNQITEALGDTDRPFSRSNPGTP